MNTYKNIIHIHSQRGFAYSILRKRLFRLTIHALSHVGKGCFALRKSLFGKAGKPVPHDCLVGVVAMSGCIRLAVRVLPIPAENCVFLRFCRVFHEKRTYARLHFNIIAPMLHISRTTASGMM